jgi:hypothetical protein
LRRERCRQSSTANRCSPNCRAQRIIFTLPAEVAGTVMWPTVRPSSSTATTVWVRLCASIPRTTIDLLLSSCGWSRRAVRRTRLSWGRSRPGSYQVTPGGPARPPGGRSSTGHTFGWAANARANLTGSDKPDTHANAFTFTPCHCFRMVTLPGVGHPSHCEEPVRGRWRAGGGKIYRVEACAGQVSADDAARAPTRTVRAPSSRAGA